MNRLYSSPLRVYLCLGFLALIGLYSGTRLPVSLFPNSTKPRIVANVPYGSYTADEFLDLYGRQLEDSLQSINAAGLEIEKLEAHYKSDRVEYSVQFNWGVGPQAAQKEVQTVVNTFSSRFSDEIRNGIWVWPGNDNSGFIAISFYSATRSLDDIYDILEPVLVPKISKVQDASDAELWNPTKKEVRVELNPGKMAALQLLPKDVSRAISTALDGESGGAITVGTQQLNVQMPRSISSPEDLNRVLLPTPSGRIVHLSDVAKVDFALKTTDSKSFKTSGAPSLILYADPKSGGNVKRMAEGIIDIVKESMPLFPKDIRYEILVDPSEFINSAIHNVLREVGIGALLAVAVLFLFIGSIRNTITAAIEIPLSMVLAFILMKFSGMNLNLISLGGLALSAGMNVDASVVVMENIFRHFEEKPGPHDFNARLKIVGQAVSEVRFAVIASTIASLVVFLPLALTSDLSYAILGDLAKTVVFSHGFSMFVALILVPTVRLQLMSRGGEKPVHSPFEKRIRWVEDAYSRLLKRFVHSPGLQKGSYLGLALLLAAMIAFVLPRLPRDVIGNPDTDWMYVSLATTGNTMLRQMESQTEEIEANFLQKLGSHVRYTFTQVRGPNRSSIMARLKDKGEMKTVWKEMESFFTNTPFVKYWFGPWNPAELPIPNPPQIQISVRGGALADRIEVTRELDRVLEENQVLPRVSTDPSVDRAETVELKPNLELWPGLRAQGVSFLPADLIDLARVATTGRRVDLMSYNGRTTDIFLRYPDDLIRTPEDLGSLPVGVGSKIVPLRALTRVNVTEARPNIYRLDQREVFDVFARQNESDKDQSSAPAIKSAHELVEKWQNSHTFKPTGGVMPTITFEDAEKDVHDALKQLGTAAGLSILLIFLTLLVQFGSVANALLVLVAVPLGLIGVLMSLFVFRSTLSLNSILGVILLNGIAVANSIILVDFMKRLVDGGMPPAQAAVEAGRKRLRPILITSATTILGMLPIALGMGEGGRILQPLGIAVSGGLWVSMGLTLFVVPALQVAYLSRRNAVIAPSLESRGVVLVGTGALTRIPTRLRGLLPRSKRPGRVDESEILPENLQ